MVILPKTQTQMEKYFNFDKNDTPHIKDIMRNISLVLVNSHYSLGYIKPELPNVVNIAGLHKPSLNPLPEVNLIHFSVSDQIIQLMNHEHIF